MRPRPDYSGLSDPGSGSGASAWPVMVSAVLLSGAVAAAVAAATLRYGPDPGSRPGQALDPGYGVEPAPRIAAVRLAEITAAYTTRAAAAGVTPEGVRAWGEALETALERVASRHGAVLLPARAVAAGAPDMTRYVERTLAAILARGRRAGTGTPPGEKR